MGNYRDKRKEIIYNKKILFYYKWVDIIQHRIDVLRFFIQELKEEENGTSK
jgi:hypothetical protein